MIAGAVRFVDAVASTQDEVRAWALRGEPEGAALCAASQAAGRGRLGRRWEAAPGDALMMSVLLRPKVAARELPLISLAAGVALVDVVGPGVGLKWPNDVLAPDGRKLAGILAEVEWMPSGPAVIVGVGLNVRAAPPLETATCLRACGLERPIAELAAALRDAMVERALLAARDRDAILAAWSARSFTLGRRVRVGEAEGLAVGLAGDGGLRLRPETGPEVVVRAGDVAWIGQFGG